MAPAYPGLLSGSRLSLQVCVQVYRSARHDLPARAHSEVSQTLDDLRATHPLWESSFPPGPVLPQSGCPDGYVAPTRGAVRGEGIIERRVYERSGDVPSPFRLFVFIVPDAIADSLFEGQTYVEAAYEMSCHGDASAEVTTAVFVPESALANPNGLRPSLTDALGFVSR